MIRTQWTDVRSIVSCSPIFGTSRPYATVTLSPGQTCYASHLFVFHAVDAISSFANYGEGPSHKALGSGCLHSGVRACTRQGETAAHHVQLGPRDAQCTSKIIDIAIDHGLLYEQIRVSIVKISGSS